MPSGDFIVRHNNSSPVPGLLVSVVEAAVLAADVGLIEHSGFM